MSSPDSNAKTSAPSRRLYATVLLAAAVLVLGQAFSLGLRTSTLWPFSDVRPFARFPSDFTATSEHFIAVTESGEVDLVDLTTSVSPGVTSGTPLNHRLIKRHRLAISASLESSALDSNARMKMLHEWVASQLGTHAGQRLLEIRFYRMTWDLSQQKVVHRDLLAAYSP